MTGFGRKLPINHRHPGLDPGSRLRSKSGSASKAGSRIKSGMTKEIWRTSAPHPEADTTSSGGARYESVRSEEHTSELQSLMRNSYAVFCLKKKKTQRWNNRRQQ